jgi:uncharacterized protein (DUF2132 family)
MFAHNNRPIWTRHLFDTTYISRYRKNNVSRASDVFLCGSVRHLGRKCFFEDVCK